MSFVASGLSLIKTNVGGGPQLWQYRHATDPHTDVDDTDYFTAGATTNAMRLYDMVAVIDIDTATLTWHFVSAIDSDGNVTVSSATLS